MFQSLLSRGAALAPVLASLVSAQDAGIRGDPLPRSAIGPAFVETMAAVEARDALRPIDDRVRAVWNGEAAKWSAPGSGVSAVAVPSGPGGPLLPLGGAATSPRVWTSFIGPGLGGLPGGGWIPPDTCGAAGPDHFVSIVNSNLSVYSKSDGSLLSSVGLIAFWNSSQNVVGDPRVLFDSHSQRFVALATDFSRAATIYVALSLTSDPTGSWFKFSFRTDQGSNNGDWPDYPTLGVDANGIYTAAYMVGGQATMTIWAIDKAPLLSGSPSVGTISAWRDLPWEGAIQPCATYGTPGSEYLVSRRSRTELRIRRISGPMTAPTLFEVGNAVVPRHSSPPNAPALGSSTDLSTGDYRPMNAVFRNGSVWTAQGVSVSSRAAVRWYEIGVSPVSTLQTGTIEDPVWHYFYGTISVDAAGDVALGFSGSHANAYATAFVTGRLAGDPPDQTAPPTAIKAGEGPYERVASSRNRWGDYSLVTVDPVDDLGFWTIQEYARTNNNWGTWIAQLGYEVFEYGSGHAGTNGVPHLRVNARPTLGQTVNIDFDNSSGATAIGVLVIGRQRTSQVILGGTLLVTPIITASVSVTVPFATVGVPVPANPAVIGKEFRFQGVQIDAGASQGVSFTPGLEVRPVTR